MSNRVTLGLVQMSAGDNKQKNVERTLDRVREAKSRGAGIVCLEELFASRYFCQAEDGECFELAEPIPGPTTLAISSAAKELAISIVASASATRLATA